MSDVLLRAEHVAWQHGADGSGVRDVSLSLARGTITGFLGRNGAGKSTTMRLLAGVLVPRAGLVTLDGVSLTSSTSAAAGARRRIGWAPEEPPTSPGLTVREHLCVARRLARPGGRGIDDVVDVLDLGGVVDRLAGALSKGTRQRLGIAMALLGAPDVLLLDEPAAGLDPAQSLALREVLRAEKARGAAILVSSHVVAELGELIDDVVAIRDGVTVFAGPVSDLAAATAAALAAPMAALTGGGA
jgi:ABC-2 type transport system ATP-binding protein